VSARADVSVDIELPGGLPTPPPPAAAAAPAAPSKAAGPSGPSNRGTSKDAGARTPDPVSELHF